MAKIGMLEVRGDLFVQDLVSRLEGCEVEFLSFGECLAPVKSDCRVVVDRLSYSDPFLREIVKSFALNGTYVLNNPFSSTTVNKILNIRYFDSIGIPHPKAFVLPRMDRDGELKGVVCEPDWDRLACEVSFPCVLKPFDGYAWANVYRISSLDELRLHYEGMKYDYILLVEDLIEFVDYYRLFCINKRDVLVSKWNPKPFDMGEYVYSDLKQIDDLRDYMVDLTVKLNKLLDFDINAVEWCITKDRQAFVLDAFNEVPDVVPTHLPKPYYNWIVEKFSECIRDKCDSDERNKMISPL